MASLLVSVRNVDEAETALAGGADLIDVKEPSNGPLGRADALAITTIIRAVDGRAPVSAAAGELELKPPSLPNGLWFVKFGLAGWVDRDWRSAWKAIRLPGCCRPVAVAYADWRMCRAPSIDEVAAFAIQQQFAAFLIDTFAKDGRTLIDHLPPEAIVDVTIRCQSAGIPIALAGSLGLVEIERLRRVQPDWFAVRGAACRSGRDSAVCAERVRQLKAVLSTRCREWA